MSIGMSYKYVAGRIQRGDAEWSEVQLLATACLAADGQSPRLIAGQHNYTAREAAGSLVGYLGIAQMVPNEIELSGMVHPTHRRCGVFNRLLQVAKQQITDSQVESIILICAADSQPGQKLLEALGATHEHNEYRMEMDGHTPRTAERQHLSLRKADSADRAELARQNSIYFGDDGNMPVNVEGVWLAETQGCPIGKVEASLKDGRAFIYGLGVLPEHRRQGYGREILLLTLAKLSSGGATHFALEVASKNASALGLYQSVGFTVTAEYGYYVLPRQQLLDYLTSTPGRKLI